VNKFKVGEKVAVYFGGERHVGNVVKLLNNYKYEVDFNGKAYFSIVHEKQMRRLVNKNKQKLGRDLWFCRNTSDSRFWNILEKPASNWDEVIHVREILE
jgi:hypothetical protein